MSLITNPEQILRVIPPLLAPCSAWMTPTLPPSARSAERNGPRRVPGSVRPDGVNRFSVVMNQETKRPPSNRNTRGQFPVGPLAGRAKPGTRKISLTTPLNFQQKTRMLWAGGRGAGGYPRILKIF